MSKIVGIDLGTINSVVTILENGEPVVIPNSEGDRTTPSIVALKNNEYLVGKIAKNQQILYSENTVSSIKRHMGTRDEIYLDGKKHLPEEISAKILQKIKRDAESYLGSPVTKAVITVPAYFNNEQREATKKAGEIAGLEVLRIINEPTAAALAYGLNKNISEIVFCFDFGGGTMDASILEISDGVFEVKSTSGDTHLGGDDIDQELYKFLIGQEPLNQLTINNQIKARLMEAVEKAKIELSSASTATINLPFLSANENGPIHFEYTLTRAKFEEIILPWVMKTKKSVDQALADAKLTTKDIDEVILVGGSTRIPLVQQKIKEWIGKEPCKSVNPDEVVAIGAAIQASILAGETEDIVLLDVTPLTLGVETLGGRMTPMINRNTTIPTSVTETYTTARDSQTSVEIHVLQGERPMAHDNKSIGRFMLEGIPPAPAHVPQIEVTFDIDTNGILSVSAKDKATNKEQTITITGSTTLTDEEIKQMIEDAKKYEEEDKKKREEVDKRIAIESNVYSTKKLLEEFKDKIPEELKEEIESYLSTIEQGLQENNMQLVEETNTSLQESMKKIGEYLYQQNEEQQKKDGEVEVEAQEIPETEVKVE